MSEVVVPIRAGIAPEPPSGEVNPAVVKELQEMLDKANCGEITGFAYASLHPGDLTTYCSVGRITRGVIGAISILQYSLSKFNDES